MVAARLAKNGLADYHLKQTLQADDPDVMELQPMFRSITVTNFRGFSKLAVAPLSRVNLVVGRNNVGKTGLLEAVFLLVGPTNPQLTVKLGGIRGVTEFRNDAEDIWGWLFFEKRTHKPIDIKAESENRKNRTLTITLADPKKSNIGVTRVGARNKWTKSRGGTFDASSSTSTPSQLNLKYWDEDGTIYEARATVKEDTIALEHVKPFKAPMSIYLGSKAGYITENADRFSKLEEIGKQDELLPAMKIIEPRLKRMAILVTGAGPVVHADIGTGRMIPVQFMGDGMGRLLSILLAIHESPGGVVLVDEVENGLHYSAMKPVWGAIAIAARDFNVQVISTTHSWECLRAAHEALVDSAEYDLTVHRLDRRDGQIESLALDRRMVQKALEAGMELR